MAVGRISGPLLAQNLQRNGIDLAFETSLLYLDVTNNRIGINKSSPQYTLDVNGTSNLQNLIVTGNSKLGNLSITSSSTGTVIANTLSNLIIQAPVDSQVLIQNDTLITGNLHATGNITANGSVQIGNMTGSDTLSLFADIVSDITPQVSNQYNIGNENQYWANGYFNTVIADQIKSFTGKSINIGAAPGQDPNVAPITNPNINLNGNVRIWGDNPLGTAPVTTNVLYVTVDGSDTNDGRAMDPSRACRTISGAIRSPYYKSGTSIKVAPGHYLENNPIELKPYTSVIGSDLRTTVVEPINKTQDLFHVQSGCYLAYMQFINGQSGLLPGNNYTPGTNRSAYATAFPPNYGSAKIDLYHSPYVQNCTNQSGPWLQDGTMFVPNQTVQIPEAVATATWVANTTTMLVTVQEGTLQIGQTVNIGPTPQDYVNARTLMLANKPFIQEQVIAYIDQNNTYYGYNKTKCIRDVDRIIESLVIDLVFSGNGYTQSNFAGLQYWNQAGYTGAIASELTTTTAAINFVSSVAQRVVQKITTTTHYQSTVTQYTTGTAASSVQASTIAGEFGLIVQILNTGTAGVTDIIVPNGFSTPSADAQNAFNLLQSNKSYIQAETIAYINSTTSGFSYDQAKCSRDIGYMIDSVGFDLLYGGNRQAIQSGVYYYGFSSTSTALPNEIPQTVAAYYRIKDILPSIITNQPIVKSAGNLSVQDTTSFSPATVSESTALQAMINKITAIISAGLGAADSPTPVSTTASSTPSVLNAAHILQNNKEFIADEVINYIDQRYSKGFIYNQVKCARDTGLIVDSIALDLLYPTANQSQSTFAGLQYWNQNAYVGAIASELTTTTAAVNFLSAIAQRVVTNTTTSSNYQSGVPQNTVLQPATAVEQGLVGQEFGIITNILQNGISGITDQIVPNGSATAVTNIIRACANLQINKPYMQAEVIAYINSTTSGFSYNTSTCVRDVGYMIDSVCFDLLHGGNRQAIQSGAYYYTFASTATNIPNEIPQTIAAYDHIRNIASRIITGQTVTPSPGNTATQYVSSSTGTSAEVATVYTNIDVITNIINNGPSAVTNKQPINLTASTTASVVNAYNLLTQNRNFIQQETIAFINQFTTGFVYNREKCYRDVGIILENLSYDVAFGGNQKSVENGIAYWNGVTSVIPTEISQTIDAINYINTLSQLVITNSTATNLLNTYQTSPQVFNSNLINGGTAGPLITKLLGITTNIISSGTSVAPPIQIGNGPDWGTVSAEVLLHANRQFIQTEVVNWVNDTYPGFNYKEELCYRDTGYIIDAISQDIVLNANAKSIEAGLTYWTGAVNVISAEVTETVSALDHAKAVALSVINNTTASISSFTFNGPRCYRDTGLIVDALAQDLLFGGSSQSAFAGIQYWNHGTYVGKVGQELTTTTQAINYVSQIAQQVVTNTTGTRYSTGTQITNLPAATSAQANVIAADFSTITNILVNGVTGVTNSIVPNSITASSNGNVIKAYNLLQANKTYIQQEAIAWIEKNKNFNYNTATCARDTGLIVDSIALDLAFPTTNQSQATFAGLQYWSQAGYTGQISAELTTTTNAINHAKTLALGYISTTPEQNKVTAEFNIVTGILTGTISLSTITNIIQSNGLTAISADAQTAYTALQNNKASIISSTISWINSTYPGFNYNSTTCARDLGYIIDSVSFDLLYGGNRQAVQSGVYYYSFSSTSTAIPNEMPQTIAAYEFVKALTEQVVQNKPVAALQTSILQTTNLPPASDGINDAITTEVTRITDIIQNGPAVVSVKQPISLVASTSADNLNAAAILLANKEFIKAETIAYLNQRYVYQYDAATCYRDVGFMIDSVSFDLLYGGNRQAVQSGVYYWGYNGTSTSLPKERVASTQAYQYMAQLANSIITGVAVSPTYQNTVTQVISVSTGTQVEADTVTNNVTLITNIINQGPGAAPDGRSIPLTRSNNAFVNNAAALLEANRTFIQAEVCAYVQSTVNSQVFLPFYDKGADATLSIQRNFDIIKNIIQNGPTVAPPTSQGNGIFLKTGLNSSDTRVAPIITNISTVSTGVYQVDINESTIGYGDNQPLYFGQTAVFPLLDVDVPDRWQQRRINPIGSMGGSLVDGGVVSDRSPIKSFVYDAFTQVNQGGIGIHITNNGYAQLVSVFTIFCNKAVIVENGGICSITNSNSNFGDYCLIAKGYGKREFSGYVRNLPDAPYYPNGIYPVNGEVKVFIADPRLRPHIGLVMEVEPPADYRNVLGLPGFISGNTTVATLTTGTINITGIDTSNIVVGQEFYVVDYFGNKIDSNGTPYVTPGTVVTDVNFETVTLNYPLNSGGGDPNNASYFSLYTAGKAYYTVLSSTVAPTTATIGSLLLPSGQNTDESATLAFINTLSQLIINNQAVTPLQTGVAQVTDSTLTDGSGAGAFITNDLNIMSSILVNGLNSAPKITTTGTLPTGAGSAASLLAKNRAFIQAEVVTYVNENFFPSLNYNQAKCLRDAGLIVDALTYDLANGGNYNAVILGKSYYAQDGTFHLVQLEEGVTDPTLFPDDAIITFYQRSYMSASGYLFEYVGAGSNYGALPQVGRADPIQSQEVIQLNNGKVFYTSTDQNGDFRIGPGLVISQATGVLSGRTFTKSLFANLTPFILAIEG